METRTSPLARIIFLGAAALSAAPLLAQDVTYDLLPGSFLRNDCPVCDRPTIEEPLSGSFVLSPSASMAGSYDLTAIDLSTTGSAFYSVKGEGTYALLFTGQGPRQSLDLQLKINDESGIQLKSGVQVILWPWPAISIEVTEVTDSQTRVYFLRLLAIPHPAKQTPYRVLTGSYFLDECLPCGRPTIPIPIVGSFALHPLGAGPLFESWAIEGLELEGLSTDAVRVSGVGIYRQGGEVALLQEMVLEATVNQAYTHVTFSSGGLVSTGAALPRIEIDLQQLPPNDPFHTFSIHLVAAPEGTGLDFRRGDSNDDGIVDISDAVNVIFWLFGAGEEPPCLDAADGDGSGVLDLTDPIFILDYLFLAGKTPPAPGPDHCGPAETATPGCNSFKSCQQAQS